MTWWLTRSLADVPLGDAWLGPAERAALGRLRIEKRRRDWRLGRCAAKAAAAAFLGVDPGRVEIVVTPGGAPVAQLDGARAAVELSLSHRAGRALAVVAPLGPAVGCDLELVEPRSGAFLDQWLAPCEQALVACTPVRDRPLVANLIWSAKEAAAKARGEGLRLAVRDAKVSFADPVGGLELGLGVWRALDVDWGEAQSPTDTGWFLPEAGWVIAVVGGAGGGSPQRLE